MKADMCQLCKEIWNGDNLISIKIKDKNLNLCPDCFKDFTDEYVAKNGNIKRIAVYTS